MINIGTCKACVHRNEQGDCLNWKIHEDGGYEKVYRNLTPEQTKDHLVYSYSEGGSFWVGENFGCVHWQRKPARANKGHYDIWTEGYAITGNRESASLLAKDVEADNFREACIIFSKTERGKLEGNFDEHNLSFWSCGLFDNENDARKSFG